MIEKMKKHWKVFICILLIISLLPVPVIETNAAGSYYLQVNKGTNVVTVYSGNGTPIKAMICSTGYATPTGTYYTSQKLRWQELDGPTYGQYCTRITGHILFHSVWYYQNGNLASQSHREYNRLGTTASHGCVRLTVGDAKWVYENCSLSTKVVIINGTSANDPLGKPSAIKLNPNQKMGWDPTDPAAGNPYASMLPSINTGGKATQLQCGDGFHPLSGIRATDTAGNDISARITYAGEVDSGTLGSYTIYYSVTDVLGRFASATVTYQVVDNKKAELTGVKSSTTKEYNKTIKLRSGLRAKAANGKNLTDKIKIKIIYPGSKKEKTYKKNSIKLTKIGTYKINYYVTNPNNNQVTKKTWKVIVKDTKAPKLLGVSKRTTLEYGGRVNLMSGVTSKLVSGKSMTKKIEIKILAPGKKKYTKLQPTGAENVNYKKYRLNKIGTYTVVYTIKNPNNKKAITSKTKQIIVKDTKPPLLTIKPAKISRIEVGKTYQLYKDVSAKLISGGSVSKANIKITILDANGNTLANPPQIKADGTVVFTQAGNYKLRYKATNVTSKKTAQTDFALEVFEIPPPPEVPPSTEVPPPEDTESTESESTESTESTETI